MVSGELPQAGVEVDRLLPRSIRMIWSLAGAEQRTQQSGAAREKHKQELGLKVGARSAAESQTQVCTHFMRP